MNSTKRTVGRSVSRIAGVATVSAVAITGVAGTALAQTSVFEDAKGDMKQGADIQKVRVVNGDEKLRINVRHRDLVRSYKSGSSIAVYLDTDRSRSGPEFVFAGATFEGGDYAILPADGFEMSSRRQVPLHGGSYIMRIDYVEDVARIAIDQVVLGDPRKVRVAVKTGAGEIEPGSTTPEPTSVDWLGQEETFTPWVAKG